MLRRTGWRTVATTSIVALALVAAGCGDDEGEQPASDQGAGDTSAGVAHAEEQIAKYRAVPKFEPPGKPFDARKAVSGKTLLSIPASSAVPFVKTIQDGMKGIAKDVGLNFTDWPNQGRPVQWQQGMNAALDRDVDAVNLLAGINPEALGPQVDRAQEAGIPVIASHLYDVRQEPAAGVETVDIPYEQAGRLLADWVIAKTKADAEVLVVTINEVLSTKPMVAGIEDEFDQHCGSGCKLTFINSSIAEVATRIQPQVQSALIKNPNINYVIALYDSAQAPFVVAGLKQAGAQDRVKVVTFNGTPSVLELVQNGDVEMDIGESLDWISYGVMDQAMRLLGDMPPVEDPRLPIRIFDKDNVDETGTPPSGQKGYGETYTRGYTDLWGLTTGGGSE